MSHQSESAHERKMLRQRERRAVQSEEQKAQRRAYLRKKDAEFRAWLDAIKLERGCVDCGYREHPKALHFDHLKDKVRDVCDMGTVKRSRALEEISKCEVRCANCHSIKSYERLQAAKASRTYN